MDPHKISRSSPVVPLAGGALMLLLLHAAASELMAGTQLDLGTSLNLPTVGHGRFLAVWMLFASLAAGAFTFGLARHFGSGERFVAVAGAWNHASDRKWIVYASIFAFLVPAVLRTFLLGGAPLTDDESAYRFMAQVLATGRVYADSPPLKLFFDNRFMVNDGKLYAHFFLGWPALLAPGVVLGLGGFMNAVYSALTVPALFATLRRLVGSGWARVGVLLYLASPMMMVAAATETAHTSCLAALAWFTLLCLKSRDEGARWWVHSGAAVSFCVAFFIRPGSALGVGLPLLLWWLVGLRPGSRVRGLVAFALPAAALAALFLAVNLVQNGAIFEVAYQRAFTYAESNGFRFSLWPEGYEGEAFSELEYRGPWRSLAIAAAGLFRLNISLWGWPCSLLFAMFAGRGRLRATLGLSLLSYLALHFSTNNVGIDTFAPMHYFEMAWPVLLLTVCGLERLTASLVSFDRPSAPWRASALPSAAVVALTLVSLLSYVPVRFTAIERIADNVAMPRETLREMNVGPSVIFAPDPFIHYCASKPTEGWVFSRPNNDPGLDDPVLWVNHLSLEKDRLLMQRLFPDRQGLVMAWDQRCRVVYFPLETLKPGTIPDARVRGIDDVGV